jgi:iron complex outermembrane receptor protein
MAVSAAFSASLVGIAPSVLAQTPPAQSLERVEITGSLIKRIEGETALPVTILKVDELQAAGATNAEQAMRLITQGNAGLVSSGSVSQTNGAASYASLRSLGAQRTLVLLNGKRVVTNPYDAVAVDLNALPLAALDRIEVLSDGASSTYGTDAIAGVINFITRRDYQGITIGGDVQIPEEGGGEVYLVNLLGGLGDLTKQGWNVFGGFNFRKQEPMGGTERDFMRTSYIPSRGFNGLSPTTFPANYTQASTGVNVNPTYPNCNPPTSISTAEPPPLGLTPGICGADTQSFTTVIPDQEQWSAFLRGSLALGKDHTASLEYFYAENTLFRTIAPSPEGGLTMPNTSPFYPGNGITPANPALNTALPISVSWRTTVLGARANEQTNETQRVVASVQGLFADWDYQVAALWSEANVNVDFNGGYGGIAALRAGIAGTGGAPFLNPFGEQTPAGLAYLNANTVTGTLQEAESTLKSLSGVVSRQFGGLPGGPMSIALAAEFRKEENVFKTDTAKTSQTTSSGLAGQAALREGDRDVRAVAIEMTFPILKNLEIGAGVRYDDYSDFGSTTNPKISFRYTPIQSVLVRGSYNTGFAAPTLDQLYSPNATTFTGSRYNDPVLCPGGVVNLAAGGVASRDCNIQFQQLTGGNTALTPEESKAWTIGFIFQPVPQFSIGFDWWDYKVENNISTIGDPAIFADPAKYASLFVRCSAADPARIPTIPGCNVPGGDPLAYVINTNLNLGDTVTDGIDWQLNWNPSATPYGRFSFGWRGTYVNKYEFQKEKGGQFFNPVGNYNAQYTDDGGSPGPVFRYKQIFSLGWDWNEYGGSLLYTLASSYKDSNANIPAPFNDNTVGHYGIFDLSFVYRGFKGLTLRAGILNVLDEDPPFTNQTARFQARAYDDRFHNPLGRTWTLGASYQF